MLFSFGEYNVQEPSLDGIERVLSAVRGNERIAAAISTAIGGAGIEQDAEEPDSFRSGIASLLLDSPQLLKGIMQAFVYDDDGMPIPAEVSGKAKPSDLEKLVAAIQTDDRVLGGLVGLLGKVKALAAERLPAEG